MADQMDSTDKPTKPTNPTNSHAHVASARPNADTTDTAVVNDTSLVYNCQNPKAIVLAFHGGCFMHGHAGWDAKQNTMLASMHFKVHQLAFPKSWKAWQAWAKAFCWDAILPKQQNNDNGVNGVDGVKVVCLGRSSGGYLACMFAAMHASHIDKLILMAPVLDPQKRASILTQFKANTDLFFASDSCDAIRPASFDPAKTLLLLAGKDENVPAWMFTTQQINQAVFPGPVGHVGLLGCTSGRLKHIIQEFMG